MRLLLLSLILLFFSCKNSEAIDFCEKIVIKTISSKKKQSQNLILGVAYPVILPKKDIVLSKEESLKIQRINSLIMKKINTDVDGYISFAKEDITQEFIVSIVFEIFYNKNNFLSINFITEKDGFGVGPISFVQPINFNFISGSQVVFSDIFTDNSKKKIALILKSELIKQADCQVNDLDFIGNFVIRDKYIYFLFGDGETPRICERPRVRIQIDDLKKYFKSDFLKKNPQFL